MARTSEFIPTIFLSDQINSMARTSEFIPTIFLSHSGQQKKPFTEYLYNQLREVNHSCFFDQDSTDSLRKGDKLNGRIFQCIKGCKLGVVVISEEFITSLWPMAELQQLISAEKRIYPIFYGLRPGDLVKKAKLKEWETKWNDIKFVEDEKTVPSLSFSINEWKKCLAEIRLMAGSEFNHLSINCPLMADTKFNPSENQMREFIDNSVVREICKLYPPPAMYYSDDTFNKGEKRMAEEIAETFRKLSETAHEQENVEHKSIVVGVHGIGGSGKSTLCKTMANYYNEHGYIGMSHFMELPSTDEAQSANILLLKIKDVLKDLTQAPKELLDSIKDFDRAISVLRQRSKGRRFFLAIDNVWDWSEKHVEKILKVVLSQGETKVMVTSRKKSLLQEIFRNCKIDNLQQCIIHAPSMNPQEAWDLIVGNIHDEEIKVIHKKKIMAIRDKCVCNGSYHPLLLYTIGKKIGRQANIYSDNEIVMDECVKLLEGQSTKGNESEEIVLTCLESSYYSLSDDLKSIFINAVMLQSQSQRQRQSYYQRRTDNIFTGMRIVNGFKNGSDIINKMKELEQHGLLKVIYKKTWVHKTENLWFHETWVHKTKDEDMLELQIHDLFVEIAEKEAIRRGKYWNCDSPEPKNLTDITRVFIHDSKDEERFKSMMQSHVDKCELVAIYSSQFLKKFRKQTDVSQYFGKDLRILWLSCWEISKISGFNALPNLMYLYLECCDTLEEITDISCLHKLQELSLSLKYDFGGSRCIQSLAVPDLSHCTNLRRLKFSSDKLSDFSILKCSTTLEVLELYGCNNLVHLQGLEHLDSLQAISLLDCWGLKEFPIVELPNLKYLRLKYCTCLRRLLPGIDNWWKHFPNLEFLYLSNLGCFLKSCSFYGFRVLEISEVQMKLRVMNKLDVIIDRKGAKALLELFVTTSLQKLKEMRIAISLEESESEEEKEEYESEEEEEESKSEEEEEVVEEEDKERNKKIRRIEEEKQMIKVDFTNLSRLANLNELSLSAVGPGFSHQQSGNILHSLTGLTNLKLLKLERFKNGKLSLSHLTCLSTLDLANFSALKRIQKLPIHLTYLKLDYCPSLKELECLASLPNLRDLHLKWCRSLETINLPTSLICLDFQGLEELKELPNLSSLTNLEDLLLYFCTSLVVRVDELICLTNLEKLNIGKCHSHFKEEELERLKLELKLELRLQYFYDISLSKIRYRTLLT